MRVHSTIKSMVDKNYFPVVIGQEDHVEVKGIVGDLDNYIVVRSEDDLEKLRNDVVFECDYELENGRYLVTRKLEEIYE